MRPPRWRSFLAALGCLTVVAGLNATLPPDYIWHEEVRGPADAVVSGDRYDIEILMVVVAEEITGGYRPVVTDQVFVAVNWQASVKRRVVYFQDVHLRTSEGLEYSQIDELSNFALPTTRPGFTSSGVSVFEVPPDLVDGADLVIGPDQGVITSHGQLVIIEDVVTPETLRHPSVSFDEPTTKVTR